MRAFCALLAFAGLAAAVKLPVGLNSFPTVPGTFIFELKPGTALGKRSNDAFLDELVARGVAFTTRKTFDSALFTGVSVTLANPTDLTALASANNVVAVRPVRLFPPPEFINKVIPTSASQAGIPDGESTHIMTGVDKVHAQGFTGKGIKVGIIDTGTDYTNPFLGGAFGPGHKVAGGTDFVGDAFTGTNTPVPDPDPLDQCNGHGTHVAGIVGANPGNPFNISGVVPDATIFSYRVFGCTGTVPDDVLTEALLRGVSDGMDILTMSLGGSDGWTESTTSVLSSRIADQGIVVTIAAGNDGQFGMFFSSSPGNGIDAISVASIDNIVTTLQSVTVSGVSHGPIAYFSLFPPAAAGNNSFPIFATSTDLTITDDACNPLPANTPNLTNVVTVVRRGTCTFVTKLTNIAAFGGNLVLIANSPTGSLGDIDTGNFTNAFLIQQADGDFLVNQFAAGAPIKVAFPQVGGAFDLPNTATGGLVSTFTSFGPTNDMFFKPAVAAPGGNIVSTFPVPLGTFAMLSGTSMATPFTAGVSALLLQTKGKGAAKSVRTLLETTSTVVPQTLTDGAPPQTLAQAGAGMLNAFNAINFKTVVTPGELLLNDTAHFNGVHTISVKNTGKTLQTYKLTHVPAGTAITLNSTDGFVIDSPVPQTTDAAHVTIVPSTLIVPPGVTLEAIVSITPPKVNAAVLPVYSGFIQVASSTETLRVSYLGVAAALKNTPVMDNTAQFFGVKLPLFVDGQGDIVSAPRNFTFVGPDAPALLFRLQMGTPALKIDLVAADEKVATTLDRRAGFGGFGGGFSAWWPRIGEPARGSTFAKVPTLGPLFEFDFIPRTNDDPTAGADEVGLVPAFANGTAIPNGQYRVLLRALKISGDPANEADYEVFLSPPFGVAVAA